MKTLRKEINTESGVVTLHFGSGQTIQLGLGDLRPDLQRRLALHGLTQKLGDAATSSIAAAKKAGDPDPIKAGYQVVEDLTFALRDGRWSTGAARDAEGKLVLLMRAVARIKGMNIDDVRERLASKTKAELAELRKHPRVKAAIAAIRAEAAGSEIDV